MYDTVHQVPDAAALFALASDQAGYFTSAQARTCGYDWRLLSYHTGTGRFIRLRRGLYRFRDYPSSRHEEVMAAWLAVGREHAAVSHESALDLLDLSDAIPDRVHLTVPRSRRGIVAPSGAVLHTTMHPLSPDEIMTKNGIRLTEPMRAILDAAETGTASEQIILAIRQARTRGWIDDRKLRLEARVRGPRIADLVECSFQEVYALSYR
ncbi:MAG TPA: type IV toxin-antitoxin system AbiEi family antitoxin domain-containing protein [Chloroflexota bacterium]|nr:type IV toxin-antitoxin system AbiEi family antitoxin domain-containing protein [Chloroflexota bacterium]